MSESYGYRVKVIDPQNAKPTVLSIVSAHKADTQENIDGILDFARQNLRYIHNWTEARIEQSSIYIEGPIQSFGNMRPC